MSLGSLETARPCFLAGIRVGTPCSPLRGAARKRIDSEESDTIPTFGRQALTSRSDFSSPILEWCRNHRRVERTVAFQKRYWLYFQVVFPGVFPVFPASSGTQSVATRDSRYHGSTKCLIRAVRSSISLHAKPLERPGYKGRGPECSFFSGDSR